MNLLRCIIAKWLLEMALHIYPPGAERRHYAAALARYMKQKIADNSDA